MRLKTTTVSLVAAASMLGAPAFAHESHNAQGKATSPAQLCKTQSHKKTNHGKGKSPFAACVTGAKRAKADYVAQPSAQTAPGRLCKDQSRKKVADDKKSPFAACVVGAAKMKREHTS